MLTTLGGVPADFDVAWPATISGWLLLFCYGVVFAVLLYLGFQQLKRLSWKQWLLLLGLSVGGFFLSRVQPPVPIPSFLSEYVPASMGDGQTIHVAFLSAVPYLLAGAILGPAPALLTGLFTGLGRAVGLTQLPYDLFHFAFAAYAAAWMMGLWYRGTFYQLLRMPLVSGLTGQVSTAVLAAVAALANTTGFLASLDAALAVFNLALWPALVVGLVSGTIVTLLVMSMAQWLPRRRLRPSPMQRSVRSYLRANVAVFGVLVWIFGSAFVFFMSTMLASRVLVTEMAASSNTAAVHLDEFRSGLEDVLSQSSGDEDFARGDKASAARGLGRLYRNAEHFQEVMLIDQDQLVIYSFPAQETAQTVAEGEQQAVDRAVKDGLKTQLVTELPGKGRMFSVIVPVQQREGQLPKALIGRVLVGELAGIVTPLLMDDGTSRIIDREEEVLTAAGPESGDDWSNPQGNGAQNVFVPAYLGGEAFLAENARQSRDVHYLSPPNGSAWRVTATLPYENVLNLAFQNALPLMLVLFAATVVMYARFASYGQHLAGPISELARASRSIAAGGSLTTPVDVDRQDEVGDLGRAFTGMQKALKGRLDELSLLLEVSQDISTSIDIKQSMPVVLQGAVRGVPGAVGARAVIVNPHGPAPLAFAEGPAGEAMDAFDRTLMATMRDKKELTFNSARRMGQMFGLRTQDLPVKALFVLPLQLNNQFRGVFYVGYRQQREFSNSERDLLHTLAGQAAVLVGNAQLYAQAESGWQRLQAVLASTTDPVIVTDQTARVFILNKAMEEAFHISGAQTRGRAAVDVIESELLVKALTVHKDKAGKRNLEIVGQDGRTYIANISPIASRSGRLMGRVAVMHDVTRFKEADSLKSEFVTNVSHDLKNPLTIISQSASALGIDAELSVEQKVLTDNILSAVDRIVDFVDTMLDIERLEAGRKLEYETFDAGGLLEDLADDQWYHIQTNGLTIRRKVLGELSPITADRTALYHAVENLIGNAIKYAPDSGELLLSAAMVGDQVVISLRDRGPGIADQDQIRLFEKGYRIVRHGSGMVKGNGMGLAYVKTAAERHGGRAWCESALGKGSTFFISVPVRPGNGQQSTEN